ncbi:MAG: type II toxin-antitoxin system VapC family toxin [Thermomicrobia bacterium]|nr:type II toxin-antitoxin system VapC family toxin [Thermomicrobia bacterium]
MSNSSAICVDAGLVVRRVAIPQDAAIQAVWERWVTSNQRLIAPSLLRYEVTNALYQYQKAGALSVIAAQQALRAAFALPLRLIEDADLSSEALAMAGRFALPAAYDAHYLALAERLGATFVTTDQRLVNAVQAALPWVQRAGT